MEGDRNPRIDPQVGDLVRGVEKLRWEANDLVYVPYYRVLIVRKALFAVTGPPPKRLTTYGHILYEWLGVREHIDGSIKNMPPYGHTYLVRDDQWRALFDGPEPTIERLTHE